MRDLKINGERAEIKNLQKHGQKLQFLSESPGGAVLFLLVRAFLIVTFICTSPISKLFPPPQKNKQTTKTTPISPCCGLTTPKLNTSTAVLSFPPRTYSSGRYASVPLTVAVRPTVVVCVGEPRGANRARPKSASLAIMWRSSRMLELRKHEAVD